MYLEMKSMLQGLVFYLKEYTGFIHKNDSDKNYNKKRQNIFFYYSQHPSKIIQNFSWSYLIQYTLCEKGECM